MSGSADIGASPLVKCLVCSLSRLCLPASLSADEVDKLEGIVRRNRPLKKGEYLFKAGTPMDHVFALRSGAIKTFLIDADGNEQIRGFVLPGEMMGLDAIGASHYRSYAQALEVSLICAIKLDQLVDLSGQIPGLRYQLLHMLSQGIQGKDEQLLCCHGHAEQRLSIFLLGMSARYQKRGLRADVFNLPMSRGDIANYLDLTLETVSRLFSRFIQAGLVECTGREVRLVNREGLANLTRLEDDR
ncbi:fumarate/nitrate reduction transcriptional regulator Fnr [Pseudomonas sp. p1(2021b)]|uniref:fumarate/nitrate reduction transcriptional regulator Fnr n=1 Tax=Pseudomonas sp. p1(2021b) TaxID=2874628 RepID=UPI001CCF8CF4|nr:fumarate/nitrate reduction transcriptional regulator Fnr [Pseudomonas sp. p1(2021b)]UBM27710.1 fumarate/nitrate reduction transcriptional regulator Fnr [Pseudomonas sp. p1(2021b)]